MYECESGGLSTLEDNFKLYRNNNCQGQVQPQSKTTKPQ